MTIEIRNESGVDVDVRALESVSRFVLDALGVHPLVELSMRLVDTATMANLHEKWMDSPGPTDVLAFPMDELDSPRGNDEEDPEPTVLGDVVLCPEVARRQAREAGHSAADELHLLATHGVLHLLGYDHHDAEGEQEMFGLQDRLLASWRDGRRPS